MEEKMKEVASQLSCPSGEKGIKTAELMAVNNSRMTVETITALKLLPADVVLEIGPGNGQHVSLLLQIKYLLYYGVDISPLMVSEAIRINKVINGHTRADFSLSDGENVNFANSFFSKIFTVNTLYFWKDPAAYLAEILRVLQPDGIFCLTFATREFMEKMEFTQYGFQLYSAEEGRNLLIANGFKIQDTRFFKEILTSNAGVEVEREFVIITAKSIHKN